MWGQEELGECVNDDMKLPGLQPEWAVFNVQRYVKRLLGEHLTLAEHGSN